MYKALVVFSILALVSTAEAQDLPIPRTGQHFELLTGIPDGLHLDQIYPDYGVMTFKSPAGKLAVTDWDGKPLLRTAFTAVHPLSRDLVSAQLPDGRWALIDVPGRRMLGPWPATRSFTLLSSGHLIHQIEKDRAVLCSLNGGKLEPVSPVYMLIYPDREGTYWAAKRGGGWGLVGIDGKVQIPFVYEDTQTRGDYLRVTLAKPAGITDQHPLSRPNRTGLLTRDGRQVLPCTYSRIDDPVGGVCTWERPGACGATDLRTGKVLLTLPSDAQTSYKIANVDGKAFVVTETLHVGEGASFASLRVYHVEHGYLTKDGFHRIEVVTTPEGPLYLVRKRKSIVDEPFELRDARFRIIDPKVNRIFPHRPGLLVAMKRDLPPHGICLLGYDGKMILEPSRIGGIPEGPDGNFFGRVPVRGEGGLGYADLSGREVIPAKFLQTTFFNTFGRAAVRTESGWEVIDRAGKVVAGPDFRQAVCFPDQPYFVGLSNERIALYANSGEQVFGAPTNFRLFPVASDRLLVRELRDGKPLHEYLYALN